MDAMQITEYAQALYRTHGDRAEIEAAQKVRESEERGNATQARDWRAIQAAIRSHRGALQS
ncbi:MAG: hypothetical protein ACX93U_14960 [Salipiger thiooxidans]|jgi:hypothetical protein|uniref:Addiction module antidote protein n=1 Tax=Salipiger thiooxidans TaxID=282683 RepID=A0A1G7CLT2_9RHOB|nr:MULTISPECIES: hypothetical protein [Salipiger]EEX12627.1 conserved hypothetical protein [Citreicella sp. SE45]MAU46994.1 hypothetical protein [Salipiger sp.]MBR9837549.1 hypothetical protein [Paracoccaceae bacterium]MBN8185076.1 hypothetical protein [Salipiger thiooxidans]MCA0846379.1 hypothetical protein [Salipiger thiooxidans]